MTGPLHDNVGGDSHGKGLDDEGAAAGMGAHVGVSPRNLWDMKRFFLRYVNADEKLRQAVAFLPWGHNLLILNKDLSDDQALFYAIEVLQRLVP